MQVRSTKRLSPGGCGFVKGLDFGGAGRRRDGDPFRSPFSCVLQRRLWIIIHGKIPIPMLAISGVSITFRESRHRLTLPMCYLGKSDSAFSVVKLGRPKASVDRVLFTKVSVDEPLSLNTDLHSLHTTQRRCRGLIFRNTH